MFSLKNLIINIITVCGLAPSLFAHGHINAGAIDSNGSGAINAGDKLFMYFEEGTETTDLAYNAGGNDYGADGFLWNGNTTLTSLHQSSVPGGPYYNSVGALSGSYIELNLASVTGPEGALFAFYEPGTTDATFVYQVGTGWLTDPYSIKLTEDSWYNFSTSDPYGHIHGRMFAVDTAGDYTVTWTLHDLYTGTTGLLDSDAFEQHFTANAVPEPSSWMLLGLSAMLMTWIWRSRFKARALHPLR